MSMWRTALGLRLDRSVLLAKTRGTAARFHGDTRAQIAFLGVFGIFSFVVLLAFLVNSMVDIHAKMNAQNVADAAALAVGQRFAEGMNFISDNNVAISEYMALKACCTGVLAAAIFNIGPDEPVMWAAIIARGIESWGTTVPGDVYDYGRAIAYDIEILANTYLWDLATSECGDRMDKLQEANGKALNQYTGYPAATVVDVWKVAVTDNGAQSAYILDAPPKIPAEQDTGWLPWFSPTFFGSLWPSGNTDRRGYHYVYRWFPPVFYIPYIGPYLTWLAATNAAVSPWHNIVKLDGGATLGVLESAASICLMVDLFSRDAPYVLKDFDTARKECNITTVAYGKAKTLPAMPASGGGTLGGLSERPTGSAPLTGAPGLKGFEQPTWNSSIGATAVAQVQVFNAVSWDLFSQYWDAKLTRVKKVPSFWMNGPMWSMQGNLYH